tara:strand:+ start:3244 stop:3675 length:432 start_codon:yes stop_codon:yes gene_type:complete
MKFLLLNLFIILALSCSNKKEQTHNPIQQKLPLNKLRSMQNKNNKNLNPCSCNEKSQTIMDKTIAIRKKFESVDALKKDKTSKKTIRELATKYNTLVGKCFEANAAALFEDNDCEVSLKTLEEKKSLLHSLGIHLDQGANIRL